MLRVDGSEFRTLRHPMYVNGKHVKEVWANGIQVYPESSGGQDPGGGGGGGGGTAGKYYIAKVKGSLEHSCLYYYPEWGGLSYIDWSSCDEFTSIFRIEASFAATIRIPAGYGPMYDKGSMQLPIVRQITDPDGWASNQTHVYIYRNSPAEQEKYGTSEFEGQGSVYPLAPPYPQAAPTRTAKNLGLPFVYWNATDGRYTTGELIFRWHIEPPQIPSMYRSRFWSYGYGDTGYQYNASPGSMWLNTACVWNDKILRSTDKRPYISSDIGEGKLRAWPTCVYTHQSGSADSEYRNGLQCLAVRIYDIMMYYNVYDCWYYLEPKPGGLAKVPFSAYEFAYIPITDILYIGEESEAPEWAKHVYESDLR